MKRMIALLGLICIILCGCGTPEPTAQIAATTLPVYEFTTRLCEGTGITVTRLVTESVSCLHEYSLNIKQVKAAESAELIVISGAGLEHFMEDILVGKECIDASTGIELLESCHEHDHDHSHHHEEDSHIWLSVTHAMTMAKNICAGLVQKFPAQKATFEKNLTSLLADLKTLQEYGHAQLQALAGSHIITFHDGFSYLAESFDLHIVKAIEEESGSEASAAELIEIIELVQQHDMKAIFVEANGSASAAGIIASETGASVYTLDMAMSGDSWFDAMYHNIDTLKEALE